MFRIGLSVHQHRARPTVAGGVKHLSALLLVAAAAASSAQAAGPSRPGWAISNSALADYFQRETTRLSRDCLAEIRSLEDWSARRDQYRRQLFEMLGLDPLPARTPLHPVVTGTLDHPQFTVEKIHFQSRPQLYVTGNLYVPKGLQGPAPAVLYVCGHSGLKKDGLSYGNKVPYQRHGIWFAQHGFVCLIVDTLEAGEIEGEHHGTYKRNMWWWNARGYTPAGVEAWNGIRAIDYLQSRKEVDPERIGVTGRSGGGAASWWIAALDDRVKAAVPVAGITDLENHVVDGCVEGHCDCMFMVNTYRWDYAQVAALVAPRPLLFSNTDSDGIFPLDGVERIHNHLARIYGLSKSDKSLGLQISPGPHLDLQELQVAAMHWMNRFLKHEEPLIADAAVKLFEPEQLRVFDKLPADQKNTTIHETFVPAAGPPKVPESVGAWETQRDGWREALENKVFAGWPKDPGPLNVRLISRGKQGFEGKDLFELSVYEFTSQPGVVLQLHVLWQAATRRPRETILLACGQQEWDRWIADLRGMFPEQLRGEPAISPPMDNPMLRAGFAGNQMAVIAPRGVGRSSWNADEKKQTQIRRRFMLLGQTLEGMQVWDIRRGIQALRSLGEQQGERLALSGSGQAGALALYASLFEPPVARLEFSKLPRSHREGPNFLNILRFLDMPQAAAMAAERSPLVLFGDPADWAYPAAVAAGLGWKPSQIQLPDKD